MCEVTRTENMSCEDTETALLLSDELDLFSCSLKSNAFFNDLKEKYDNIMSGMHAAIEQICLSANGEAQGLITFLEEELNILWKEANLSDLSTLTSTQQWSLANKKSNKLESEIASTINEYYQDLVSVELKRKTEILALLLRNREDIVQLSLMDGNIVDDSFQAEIDCINKHILTNLQSYEDLKFTLQVQEKNKLCELKQILKDRAKCIAEKEAEDLSKMTLSYDNKTKLINTVNNLLQETYYVSENILQATRSDLISSFDDLYEVIDLSDCIMASGPLLRGRLEELDKMGKDLGGLLRPEIESIMDSFDLQINLLSRSLASKPEASQINSENGINCDDLKACHSIEVDNLAVACKELSTTIHAKISKVKQFFYDVKTIWTDHINRIQISHSMLDAEINTCSKALLKLKSETVSKLKKHMKIIREADNLGKLNCLVAGGETILSDFQGKAYGYLGLLQTTISDLTNKNIELLSREMDGSIDKFLHKTHVKSSFYSDSVYTFPTSQYHGESEAGDKYKDLKDAVDNRLLGIYELLDQHSYQCTKEVTEDCVKSFEIIHQEAVIAENNELSDLVKMQNELILEAKRIRSAEIMYHSDRLVEHSNAVKEITVKLNQRLQECKSVIMRIEGNFEDHFASLTEHTQMESAKQMQGVIQELEKKLALVKQEINTYITGAKHNFQSQYNKLKDSNKLFLNTAKTLKKGGNYSPNEQKCLITTLKQLEKYVNTTKTYIENKYNELLNRSQLKNITDSNMVKLQMKLATSQMEESIFDVLDELRTNLRMEVKHLQDLRKNLFNQLKRMLCLSAVDDILIQEMSTTFKKIHNYMRFPPGMMFEPLTSVSAIVDHSNKSTSVTKQVESNRQQKGKMRKSDATRTPLFEHTSEKMLSAVTDGENYFIRTKGLMIKKYNSLLKYLSDRLEPNVKQNKVKRASSNDLGKELFEKRKQDLSTVLLRYNRECEVAWYCNSRLFLDQFISFQKGVTSLIKYELESNHEQYIAKLISLKNDYECLVEKNQNYATRKRDEILRSLVLPLGHPHHNEKLANLYKLAENTCQCQGRHILKMMEHYKNTLQDKHDEYVSQTKILKDKLTTIYSLIFKEHTGNFGSLLENIDSGRKVLGLLGTMHVPLDCAETTSDGYLGSIWLETDQTDTSCDSYLLDSNSISSLCAMSKSDNCVMKMSTKNVKGSAQLIHKLYLNAKLNRTNNKIHILEWLKLFEWNKDQCELIYRSN